ncbi:hypothetical protein FOYG_15470 [Fusarium oxysporum NRRL 32931]|uniref:Uncharacterized protein n=1 Tax=Fusarium oxysporum NRRL 32931 TaxID=660029 RepID=W9HF68_FUSOX|nr:hypothetical protein FOYG_15470 [Fusarium oxysporum NRRL 32931]
MTDKQIGDKIRKSLSIVAHKQHLRIEQRLAELDAEAKYARQALLEADSANHGMLKSRERKQDAISATIKASEKAHANYEKSVEALQFVQSLGVSNMASAIRSLEKAVEDADKDQTVTRAAYDRVCCELPSFEEKAEAVKKNLRKRMPSFVRFVKQGMISLWLRRRETLPVRFVWRVMLETTGNIYLAILFLSLVRLFDKRRGSERHGRRYWWVDSGLLLGCL